MKFQFEITLIMSRTIGISFLCFAAVSN